MIASHTGWTLDSCNCVQSEKEHNNSSSKKTRDWRNARDAREGSRPAMRWRRMLITSQLGRRIEERVPFVIEKRLCRSFGQAENLPPFFWVRTRRMWSQVGTTVFSSLETDFVRLASEKRDRREQTLRSERRITCTGRAAGAREPAPSPNHGYLLSVCAFVCV